jgi:hypothetical protein
VAILSGTGCRLLKGADALVEISQESTTGSDNCQALHVGGGNETRLLIKWDKMVEKTDSFFSDL